MLLNIVNTTGEYILARLVTEPGRRAGAPADAGFDKDAFIGAFYGSYFFWVNVASVLLQVFVVSRIVKHLGHAACCSRCRSWPSAPTAWPLSGAGIGAGALVKTAENATDYSVMNTAKQMLWLPTTREEKYKAKQAIDTFFVRCGDMLSAAVVFVGTHTSPCRPARFAATNVGVRARRAGRGVAAAARVQPADRRRRAGRGDRALAPKLAEARR